MIWLVHDESGLPLYSLSNPALLRPGTLVLELDALPADLAGWRVIEGALVLADLAPAWAALRAERDRRLSACDWTQMPDASPPGGREIWTAYRAALRILPETTTDPTQPIWPDHPNPTA